MRDRREPLARAATDSRRNGARDLHVHQGGNLGVRLLQGHQQSGLLSLQVRQKGVPLHRRGKPFQECHRDFYLPQGGRQCSLPLPQDGEKGGLL